jgi:cystathionine beta-lyase
MQKRHGWETKREWYVYTPGVIFAIGLAIRALTKENDAVLIQRPVYYPFSSIIKNNNRTLINNPMLYKKASDGSGSYSMDARDFEEKIIQNNVKLFILCNPHNPVGRVWTKDELITIGDICFKHGVIVIADEIHQDFIYEGHTHQVFASLKPEYGDFTITCTSPSKTFNLAGLQVSNIIMPNQTYKRAILKEHNKTGYDNMNLFGLIATQTAYATGEEWLEELKEYLAVNLKFVREFLRERLPKVKLIEPEGTYLLWLDCSGLGYEDKELNQIILDRAKLWLDAGTIFGEEGRCFERINIATNRAVLEKAMLALEAAVKNN